MSDIPSGYWICDCCQTRNNTARQSCNMCGLSRGQSVTAQSLSKIAQEISGLRKDLVELMENRR